ncbi:MAG: Holliday junction branch migration DNA helicase RuvB [Armatimonadetes bacterium]|nr:Holliday junction branch migration DNA helicase RuvB [Armatimonadota bacterium]MDW8121648.1 Holliday junction branch migration DNA helicase RuvB [Armatimonadota bacterium]
MAARKRWLTPTPTEEDDESLLLTLRPRTFSEFVGQKEVVERLQVAIAAAKKRKEPMEHLLLYGPPGLGKTTLAYVIANELGVSLTPTTGPALERPGDAMGYLLNLEPLQILFVDEIHRMPRIVEEFLYPALESFRVDVNLSRRPGGRPRRFSLPPFTFVGATTRAGLLTKPLRERFGLRFRLHFYEPEDLSLIVLRAAQLLNQKISRDAAYEIAKRSRGTPRIAQRLLRRVRDYVQVQGKREITLMDAVRALEKEGIDPLGLDFSDREYLRVLIQEFNGGPAGLDALSAVLQEDRRTIEEIVEPYLLQIGFIRRTHKGRMATPKVWEHLGWEPPHRQMGLLFSETGPVR